MGKKPQRTEAPRAAEPAQPQQAAAQLSRGARIAASIFVAFHLFAVITWAVPLDTPLIVQCREAIKGYMLWTGLFQKWDMFAPDPSKLNNYVTANVIYRDGRTAQWTFPRMENLGYVDKYFKERYRKYASDNLRLDTHSALWPDAARYVARAVATPSETPAEIDLVRHWSEVQPPGPHGEERSTPWSEFTFYRYPVQAGDLR
jgi:hypothetical protein